MRNSITGNTKAEVVVDNNDFRITRSQDDENVYEITHNKRDNTMQVTVTGLKTKISRSGPAVSIAEINDLDTISASSRSFELYGEIVKVS